MSIKIGITGYIGMGKTTVASIFSKKKISVWDADLEVHKLYKKGELGYNKITSLYPNLKDEKKIDREKLSLLIRENKVDLSKIEKIIHPLLVNSRKNFIDRNRNEKVIVFDIPLLYETNADEWLDLVILVKCSKKVQMKRLLMRKNYDKKKIEYLLSKQMELGRERKKPNFIINTNQSIKIIENKIIDIINSVEQLND